MFFFWQYPMCSSSPWSGVPRVLYSWIPQCRPRVGESPLLHCNCPDLGYVEQVTTCRRRSKLTTSWYCGEETAKFLEIVGALPEIHLHVVSRILNWICLCTGSQCRSSLIWAEMCENFGSLRMSRVAAFSKCCTRSTMVALNPRRAELQYPDSRLL